MARTIDFWDTSGDLISRLTVYDTDRVDVDKLDAAVANELIAQLESDYDCSSEEEDDVS